MRNKSVWERACGLVRTVIEDVAFDDAAQAVVVSVRPNAKARGRCGRCARRSPGYDRGDATGVALPTASVSCPSWIRAGPTPPSLHLTQANSRSRRADGRTQPANVVTA